MAPPVLQRDAFIGEVTRALERDPSIAFLTADFGAQALDELRQRFPAHVVHCGISEQAMIDVATGLALEGRRVVVYAMAPFLSLRALEQIKCGPGLMGLPMTLLSVGVGLGYADAGPTHYATEDLACVRTIVGASVYTAADTATATAIARRLMTESELAYVRLDRHALPDLADHVSADDIERGYRVFGAASTEGDDRVWLVSHGRLAQGCVALAREDPNRFAAVDLMRCKPFPASLIPLLARSRGIVVADEQMAAGSLPSVVSEALVGEGCSVTMRAVTLPDQYVFDNGGREALLDGYGLNRDGVLRAAEGILQASHGAGFHHPVVPE